ncbi:MAG TPA: fumarylacetoacetate hydrolase family protein [Blastocatellia bacterium]|nr:fumarylacetoacetate hydrolase family protein [Blastocatellia bacterium]
MKLAQFRTRTSDSPRLGLLRNDVIVDVTDIAPTTLDVIRGGSSVLKRLGDVTAKTAYALDAVEYLPAVNPAKILAIGLNYLDHAKEQGTELPKEPMLFAKFPTSLNAHNRNIVLPITSQKVDYEAELAVVIGRRAKRVKVEEALDYVFGYAPLNDVSARDLQFSDKQFVRGKSQDTFCPVGPFVTTADEVGDPHTLKIECRVNGTTLQSSNTNQLIFNVPHLISFLSQGITLEPGDVIATGTPSGVGVFRNPPIFLKPGDVVEVEIEKLGVLQNPVVADEAEK